MQWPYPVIAFIASLVTTAMHIVPPMAFLQLAGKGAFIHLQRLGDTPSKMIEWVVWTWAFYFAVALVVGVPLTLLLKRAGSRSYPIYFICFLFVFNVLGYFLHQLEGDLEVLTRRIGSLLTVVFLMTPLYYMIVQGPGETRR